jgi:hypothetical protein
LVGVGALLGVFCARDTLLKMTGKKGEDRHADRVQLIREELARRSPRKATREYRLVDENGAPMGLYGAVHSFRIGRILTLPERPGTASVWRVVRLEETTEQALYVDGTQTIAVVAPAR